MGKQQVALTVDLGGSFLKVCLITRGGKIISCEKRPSRIEDGLLAVENLIVEIATEMYRRHVSYELVGIGVGMPGVVDHKNGIVIENSPNIPALVGYPLVWNVSRRLRLPGTGGNDAKLQALGEAYFGAGRGKKIVAFLGLGTGVGGGLVINGKVFLGHNDRGGELGHISLDYNGSVCGCGRRGCLEAYVGTPAILASWKKHYLAHELETAYNPESGLEDVKEIFLYASQSDRLCWQTVQEWSEYLALGMETIIISFSPSIFILGGQISKDFGLFKPFLANKLNERLAGARPDLLKDLPIVPGQHPLEAGCLGAARMAFAKYDALTRKHK
jgi:glucokinase